MPAKKKNIIISIPLVWSYRNFIISGICDELHKKNTVYYAIHEVAISAFIKQGISEDHLIILNTSKSGALQTYFFRIVKYFFANPYSVNINTIIRNLVRG